MVVDYFIKKYILDEYKPFINKQSYFVKLFKQYTDLMNDNMKIGDNCVNKLFINDKLIYQQLTELLPIILLKYYIYFDESIDLKELYSKFRNDVVIYLRNEHFWERNITLSLYLKYVNKFIIDHIIRNINSDKLHSYYYSENNFDIFYRLVYIPKILKIVNSTAMIHMFLLLSFGNLYDKLVYKMVK